MYADTLTQSMKRAIDETNRRRIIQDNFNREHGITPEGIKKSVQDVLSSVYEADYYTVSLAGEEVEEYTSVDDIIKKIKKLQKQMQEAARELEFERAAELRDEIKRLEKVELEYRAG
jgi:excinuclease ABC subunit B